MIKKIILYTGSLLTLIVWIIFGFHINQIENTQQIVQLLARFALLSLPISLGIGFKITQQEEEPINRIPVILGLLFVGLLLFPSIGYLVNLYLPSSCELTEVTILEQKAFYNNRFGIASSKPSQPSGYFLQIQHREHYQRLRTKNPVELPIDNSMASICSCKGFLGYPIYYPSKTALNCNLDVN